MSVEIIYSLIIQKDIELKFDMIFLGYLDCSRLIGAVIVSVGCYIHNTDQIFKLFRMFFELTIGIILRGFIYSCDLIKRPELNTITNSFEKLTENRYSQNQSILGIGKILLCYQIKCKLTTIKLNLYWHCVISITSIGSFCYVCLIYFLLA